MRSRLGAVLTAGAVLLVAAPASAAVRYAEPNGDGPPASCPRSNPCDIQDAVEDTSVQAGDEIILSAGTYNVGADEVDALFPVDVHGAVGETRPHVTSTAFTTLYANDDAHVYDVRLSNTNGGYGLYALNSTARFERVVATSNGSTCWPPQAPGYLRDTVCFTDGAGAEAVNVDAIGPAALDYRLRNVTAIATGAGAKGLNFQTDNGNWVVNVRNVIADGFTDVSAAETGSGSVDINLDYSNYLSLNLLGTNVSITPAGTLNNQTGSPELADPDGGGFHQLSGSPTIDAGGEPPDVDLLGLLDFERQPRIQGDGIDIGADEFDKRLKLKAKAKKKQKAKKLKVRVSCPEEECYVKASGRAKAGGERFKLKKTKKRFLNPGQKKKLKLKAKNLDKLKQLLAAGDGEAKIKVKGTDAGGVKAKKKVKVMLVG